MKKNKSPLLNYVGGSLRKKLIVYYMAVSLIPILLLGGVIFIAARSTLKSQFEAQHTALAQSKEKAILLFMQLRMEQIEVLANDEIVQNLVNMWNKGNKGESLYGEILASEARNFIEVELPKFSDITPFYEYVFVGKTGEVYFSTDPDLVGKSYQDDPNFRKGLKGTFVTDITIDQKTEKPFFAVVAPIYHRSMESKEAIGVVFARMRTDALNDITSDTEGMGKTGEIYIVNHNGMMVTPSRFVPDAILNQKVDSQLVQDFIETGATGSGQYRNYRKKRTVGTSVGKNINGELNLGWVIIAEIQRSEAYAPVFRMGFFLFLLALLIILVVAWLAYYLAHQISNPIREIATKLEHVAEGDLTVEVGHDYPEDEVGLLADAFRSMVDNQRTLTRQIKETVKVLASSAQEISTSTTQLATIATETATAVTETATTVEEIKQTAQVANDTAERVSDSSQTAVQISRRGKAASEETVEGMERIRGQMDLIAESIIRLNEQSQAIGEIISSVDDLANQSNLLAVNAAIEAAKAGEHGKGFAVVAQEIKNLAQQSKQATEQVRTILSEIQKATGDSVSATDKGSRAVQQGVEQSSSAGEAIVGLAGTIDESAQAALQIAASSREQLVGMDQVASAMESINEASGQNVKSVNVLEVSARKLRDLGQKLIRLVEQYKV